MEKEEFFHLVGGGYSEFFTLNSLLFYMLNKTIQV